jgi:ATP-dependent exoDNAse (exonuclease V) beta subunit
VGGRVVRAEIIDFKTDLRPQNVPLDQWIAERTLHHKFQLQAYRKVLCRQFRLHPEMVTLSLVLLSEPVVVPIE